MISVVFFRKAKAALIVTEYAKLFFESSHGFVSVFDCASQLVQSTTESAPAPHNAYLRTTPFTSIQSKCPFSSFESHFRLEERTAPSPFSQLPP